MLISIDTLLIAIDFTLTERLTMPRSAGQSTLAKLRMDLMEIEAGDEVNIESEIECSSDILNKHITALLSKSSLDFDKICVEYSALSAQVKLGLKPSKSKPMLQWLRTLDDRVTLNGAKLVLVGILLLSIIINIMEPTVETITINDPKA